MKILSTVFLVTLFTTSVYDFHVPKISGGEQSLQVYTGKKMLVITLPVIQNAQSDSLLTSIDSLAAIHKDSLQVIGVPAYENGYLPASKTSLTAWYNTRLGSYIIVTDGLHTRKASGAQQHVLFKWLTTSSENGVFNQDEIGPGSKFYINRQGELVGVMHPFTKLNSRAIIKLLEQ